MESILVRFRSLLLYNHIILRTLGIVDMVLAENGRNVAAAIDRTPFSHGSPIKAFMGFVWVTDRVTRETMDHGGHGKEILSMYHVGQSCAMNVWATQRVKSCADNSVGEVIFDGPRILTVFSMQENATLLFRTSVRDLHR